MKDQNVLCAIICGYERGGTTMLNEILRKHPALDSGFETGLLLAAKPHEFMGSDFSDYNGSLIKGGWGITSEELEEVLNTDDWKEVYYRLRERSRVVINKESLIFDKTPKYLAFLSDVLDRVPDIPALVIIKEPRGVIWSWLKRLNKRDPLEFSSETIDSLCQRYNQYALGYQKGKTRYPDRVHKIDYEKFCTNPIEESKNIFAVLNLDFKEEYLTFESRFEVHGNTVSSSYLREYEMYLSQEVISQIDHLTKTAQNIYSGSAIGINGYELPPSEAVV